MNHFPFFSILILTTFIFSACNTNQFNNCWNVYRPIYFKSVEDSQKLSSFIHKKGIDVVTLEDVILEIANFPSPEIKTWRELESMPKEDPRKDSFIQKIPTLFKAGKHIVAYVPKKVSHFTLQKYSKAIKVPLWFNPDEMVGPKKIIYLVCFSSVGLLWIFLRKPQAFFSLLALLLGIIFISIFPEIYYALITVFFAYSTLLDNWSRHYTQIRNQLKPISKTIRHTVLSWLIFLSSYLIIAIILKVNYEGIFLLSLYFIILFCSSLIWIFWVKSRTESKNLISFFPSSIVKQNWNPYTTHGFFYLGALLLGAMPFFVMGSTPIPPQAKEYIKAKEALYPELDRDSLLILYKTTPNTYPNLAGYLAHRFHQQTLPFSYKENLSFPAEEELITQKVYDFDGIHFKEEKENILFSLNNKWIKEEVESLPSFWKILISPRKKTLSFKLTVEPFSLFSDFEKQLIWVGLIFFLIFSLKLKSYFRIINLQ